MASAAFSKDGFGQGGLSFGPMGRGKSGGGRKIFRELVKDLMLGASIGVKGGVDMASGRETTERGAKDGNQMQTLRIEHDRTRMPVWAERVA